MEDYVQEKVRKDIIKEIGNLELPDNWKPQQVIDYIIRKIDKK